MFLACHPHRHLTRADKQDLIAEDGPFRTLIEEYGLKFAMTEKEDAQEAMVDPARSDAAPAARKQGATLTLDEDSEQGAVSLATYRFWLSSMGSVWLLMLLMVGYIASAGSGVSLTVWLGFWQSTQFNNLSSAAYQGIYAGNYGPPFHPRCHAEEQVVADQGVTKRGRWKTG